MRTPCVVSCTSSLLRRIVVGLGESLARDDVEVGRGGRGEGARRDTLDMRRRWSELGRLKGVRRVGKRRKRMVGEVEALDRRGREGERDAGWVRRKGGCRLSVGKGTLLHAKRQGQLGATHNERTRLCGAFSPAGRCSSSERRWSRPRNLALVPSRSALSGWAVGMLVQPWQRRGEQGIGSPGQRAEGDYAEPSRASCLRWQPFLRPS